MNNFKVKVCMCHIGMGHTSTFRVIHLKKNYLLLLENNNFLHISQIYMEHTVTVKITHVFKLLLKNHSPFSPNPNLIG